MITTPLLLFLLLTHSLPKLSTAHESNPTTITDDNDNEQSQNKEDSPAPTPTRIGEHMFLDTIAYLSPSTISKTHKSFPNYGYPDPLYGSTRNSTGFNEPQLQPMPFFGNGTNAPPTNVMVYVRPDVSTYYREAPGTRTALVPEYKAMATKFVNMSPDWVQLYWDPGNNRQGIFFASIGAFEVAGTTSYPGHQFYFILTNEPETILCRFYITSSTSLYVYDPYYPDNFVSVTEVYTEPQSIESLEDIHFELYKKHAINSDFARNYKTFTNGAEWLSLYPRSRPRHKIWRADHFGHEHSLSTRETHFVLMPPKEDLEWVVEKAEERHLDLDAPRPLQAYRSSNPLMNLTLTALSCAPRVFSIDNFLSDVEVEHLLAIAKKQKLDTSTTVSNKGNTGHKSLTRKSTNTWLFRETSPIVDTVFRRAGDLLRVDESLLRVRADEEHRELNTKLSLAESMQLVHYAKGEEYTAHYDFLYPSVEEVGQPTRYSNLIMYLNDDMEGGGTYFPKCLNAETTEGLKVRPKKGMALLYYSLLPDGNMDDLSQVAALPVTKGEKWIANIWVWDPIRI